MKRLLYPLPLLLLSGCLTVDPNAPTPPYAWRVIVALVLGLIIGFIAGWAWGAARGP
jgi:hypothetical protein